MAGTTVGNLAILLSANPGQLKTDLGAGQRLINDFAAGASGKLKKIGGFGEGAGALASGMEGLLKGGDPFKAAYSGAKNLLSLAPGGGVLAAALGTGEGFFDKIKSYYGPMGDLLKQSKRLGVDAGELSQVMALPGIDESAQEGIRHFRALIGQAAGGSDEAATKLKKSGLSVKDLYGKSLREQLEKTQGAFKKLNSAETELAASNDLFGRRGFGLQQAMAGGPIGAMMDQMLASGRGLSTEDIVKGAGAGRALKRMGQGIDAAWKQIAVKAAPLVNSGATFFGMLGQGKNPFSARNQLEYGRQSRAMEAAEAAQEQWKDVKKALDQTQSPLEKFQDEMRKIANWAQPGALATGLSRDQRARLEKQAEKEFLAADPLWHFRRQGDAAARHTRQDELDRLSELKKAGRFDAPGGDVEYERLGREIEDRFKAADPAEQLRRHLGGPQRAMADEWDRLKRLGLTNSEMSGAYFQKAEDLGLRPPTQLERLKRRRRELGDFAAGGDIDVRGLGGQGLDFLKHMESLPGAMHSAGAMVKGSAEEYSARVRFEREGARGDLQERIAKALEQAKEMDKLQLDAQKEVAKILREKLPALQEGQMGP